MRNFLLLIIGVTLLIVGQEEYGLLQHAKPQPSDVELSELEQGHVPDNRHLRIGPHWRVWNELICRYEVPKGQTQPKNDSKVDYIYYPIISPAHPDLRRMGEAVKQYGSWEAVPEKERPPLRDFKVLVRSVRYDRYAKLPDGMWDKANAVQGLLVKNVSSLNGDELKLLRSSFPKLNFGSVLILEENRTPSSRAGVLGLLGSGGALLLGFFYFLVVKRRASGLAPPPPLVELPGAA